MALFTTTPAKEIMPTPVMITPNGEDITASPQNAPPKDRSTEVKMIAGCITELNRVTRIRKISSRATTKALDKNAWASCCSWSSPVNS